MLGLSSPTTTTMIVKTALFLAVLVQLGLSQEDDIYESDGLAPFKAVVEVFPAVVPSVLVILWTYSTPTCRINIEFNFIFNDQSLIIKNEIELIR